MLQNEFFEELSYNGFLFVIYIACKFVFVSRINRIFFNGTPIFQIILFTLICWNLFMPHARSDRRELFRILYWFIIKRELIMNLKIASFVILTLTWKPWIWIRTFVNSLHHQSFYSMQSCSSDWIFSYENENLFSYTMMRW